MFITVIIHLLLAPGLGCVEMYLYSLYVTPVACYEVTFTCNTILIQLYDFI